MMLLLASSHFTTISAEKQYHQHKRYDSPAMLKGLMSDSIVTPLPKVLSGRSEECIVSDKSTHHEDMQFLSKHIVANASNDDTHSVIKALRLIASINAKLQSCLIGVTSQ